MVDFSDSNGGDEPPKESLSQIFRFQFKSESSIDRLAEFRRELPRYLDEAFVELTEGLAMHFARLDSETTSEIVHEAFNSLMKNSSVTAGNCEQCKRPMLKKSSDKRFCSATCRVQADRARNFP